MKTLQQRFVQALQQRGENTLETRGKYVVMSYTKTIKCQLPLPKPEKYFIGSHGSLRIGRSYTESRPVVESLKWILMNEA